MSDNKDLFGNEVTMQKKLSDYYIYNPFTVLKTTDGNWQKRKKIWKNIIKEKGLSRNGTLSSHNQFGSKLESYEILNKFDVSLLDPVLSEIILHWFSPINGVNVFDPFAGDTVFGFVSGIKQKKFTGIELREEQCLINNNSTKDFNCNYICDDAVNILNHIDKNSQDLLFSCPPYFDLEVYSKLENDASNQKTFTEFMKIINNAFSNSIKCLKNNRFAVIVVGDIRNKKTGGYYRFPDKIKDIFELNGMMLWNELILTEPIGRKAMVEKKSMWFRKVLKIHQNVLVFYKGNQKEIRNNFKSLKEQ